MLSQLLALPAVWMDRDLSYLPKPNTVEVVLSPLPTPADLTSTAFLLPFLDDGRCVFANNQRRGIEIAGGHIDWHRVPGKAAWRESPEQAAARECLEETGCRVTDITPIGFLRMTSQGNPPDDYPYPHPRGFQAFFAARVAGLLDYLPNDECAAPVLLAPNQVSGLLRHSHVIFHGAALQAMFPSRPQLGPEAPQQGVALAPSLG